LEFLTGSYSPASYPSQFVSFTSGSYGFPSTSTTSYLRKETADALLSMYKNFSKSYPSVPFSVVSALRTFDAQKTIWEGKWEGKYSYITNGVDRSYGILTYSSMPSTSRHHWGTDFDLTDLTPSYWTSGNGLTLYNWLVSNAAKWGFYQPYTANRLQGYSEERWHWSYAPISRSLVKQWIENKNAILASISGDFEGSENANTLAYTYVTSINANLLPSGLTPVTGTGKYCANRNTTLYNNPCSVVRASIIKNASVKTLSCCKTACSGSYRFVQYGEDVGYVDSTHFTSC